MDGSQPPSPPPRRSRRRGVWFVLLMVFGLPALFSAVVLPFSPIAALPWVIVSWSVAGLAGYNIWRIDHPGESARSAASMRARWLGAGAVTIVVVLVMRQAEPAWLVAGIGLWLLALGALAIALIYLGKVEDRLEVHSLGSLPENESSREPRPERVGDGEPGLSLSVESVIEAEDE